MALLIAAYFYLPTGLQGIPSTITLRVVNNTGQPVSGALCYVNQAGRSDCGDPYENVTLCQVKDTTDSNGICDFDNRKAFNSGFNYQVAAVCGIGVKTQTSYNPLPGMSSVKQLTCKTTSASGGGSYEDAVETPMEKPKNAPICVKTIYLDEYCGDFNYGDKYYGFLRNANNRKLCWTSPSWVFGPCLNGETPVGDTCASVPTYITKDTCDPGFTKEGEYCVIYKNQETEPQVQCDIDQTLQVKDGVKICVSQPKSSETTIIYKYSGLFGSETMAIIAGILVALIAFLSMRKLKVI